MMQKGRLSGKVAVITGTGSGQGRAAAHRFASEGAIVVGGDVNAAGNQETARQITSAGLGTFEADHVDLTSEPAVAQWFERIARTHTVVDILYANAGATKFAPLVETSFEE